MNIRVVQLNPIVGDLAGNRDQILGELKRAEADGMDLLILPEMVLTGYPVQDLLTNSGFCRSAIHTAEEIISSTGQTALLFGAISPNRSGLGKELYNAALLGRDGRLLGQTVKTLLPNYDIFDESRYFEPNDEFHCLLLDNLRLGVTICEDIWVNESEANGPLYRHHPARELKQDGADLIVNISASPYTIEKHERRKELLSNRARELGLPLIYCNQCGAQSDVVFDGDSMVMDKHGERIAACSPFDSGRFDLTFGPDSTVRTRMPEPRLPEISSEGRLLRAIKAGISDYLTKTGISDQLIIGLSGGIDSALTAVLATEAVGKDRVTALAMPTRFSSKGSIQDSEKLAENLGIELRTVPIQGLFDASLATLSDLFDGTEFGVAEENLQSRMRGAMLMAYSNKFGHMLLATGNKSELAVGYATLYGDMNGGLNPVGDLYKTEIYSLCYWLNESWYGREMIPKEILEKPPSAELRPDQKDSDSLPPYDTLDAILTCYIDRELDLDDIVSETGLDEELVVKVLHLVDANEFKRYQAPPIIKLTRKSFGIGRRWPLVQGWTGNRT